MHKLKKAIFNHQNKNFNTAKNYYKNHLLENKNDVEAIFSYSILLFEMGNIDEAIKIIDRAIFINPANIKFLNNRAFYFFSLNSYQKSLNDYYKIISIDPKNDETLNNIGRIYNKIFNYSDAINCFDKAIKINNKKYYYFYNRGNSYLKINKSQLAINDFIKSITLNPRHFKSFHNMALAYEQELNIDMAMQNYKKSIEINPKYYESYLGLAYSHLIKGNFSEGWYFHEYRSYLGVLDNNSLNGKKWMGEKIPDDKTLLIYHEQGLGDTLQFCRYLKLFNKVGFKIIFLVQEPLINLVRSLKCNIEITTKSINHLQYDFHCPLMTLPLIFQTKLNNIPFSNKYLDIPIDKTDKWKKIIGPKDKIRVALAWRGNPKHQNNSKRSYQITEYISLFNEKYEWISLHHDHTAHEKEHLSKSNIKIFNDIQFDFDDAAAICNLVDYIITVDTSFAHLGGALGKKTFVMLPYFPDYRWLLDTSSSPWYSSLKIFRHTKKTTWRELLLDAINEINEQSIL